jgi:AraC-like DNA-binding protein
MQFIGRPRSEHAGTVSQAFLVDPDDRVIVEPDPIHGALMISTTVGRLESHLATVTGRTGPPLKFWPNRSNPPGAGHRTALVDSAWRAVCGALYSLNGASPVAGVEAALEDSLLSAFLFGLPHSRSADLYTEAFAVGAGNEAMRAREWMELHYPEPLTVVDIARAVGVSVRQLQYLFLRAYGLSPIQVLRAVRLDHARRLLAGAAARGEEVTVTRIAHRCGFGHLGRFAAVYRERFGEAPSETATRGST